MPQIFSHDGVRPSTDIKPLELNAWLKDLPLAGKTKAHVRALIHLLFDRAMLWGLRGHHPEAD